MTTMSCRSFEALATVALAFKKIQHYHEEKKRAKVRLTATQQSSLNSSLFIYAMQMRCDYAYKVTLVVIHDLDRVVTVYREIHLVR